MARILCIDEGAGRDRWRRVLEASGHALEAVDPATWAPSIADAPPDLVILGARAELPRWPAVLLALRRDLALGRVPVVASGEERAAELAVALGGDGGVDPTRMDDARLGEEIASFLAGRRDALPAGREGEARRALVERLDRALAAETSLRARLAELDHRRAVFLQDLVHELSTPLTPLAGYLKILAEGKLGALAPPQAKVAEAMRGAVRKLARIVENLSDFAGLQTGQATLASAPVDGDALAADVVEELRPAARDVRVGVEVRPSGGGAVLADPRKLRQALANVVSNAVKFSPHGGEVLVEVQRDGDRLRFCVYDQGPGVRGAEAERIFEPFPHADRADEARRPGSGLGLPVARRIAEAHGGRLVVESPPHTQPSLSAHQFTGSKFVLEIPARAAAPAAPTAASG